MSIPQLAWFRQVGRDRAEEFFQKGYKKRHFFPHRIYYLPKCGPDGYKLARWMCGECDPNQLWEIVLYAERPVIAEFPDELFFDDDLVWHQQQFGRAGQIATANVLLDGEKLYSMVHISDLVQRISRKRACKTRIENRFKGWHHLLLNAILNFAIEHNIKIIYSPTSRWARTHTDPNRTVQRELFERIYDRTVRQHFIAAEGENWWRWAVEANKDKAIIAEKRHEELPAEKTICLCHDIERGWGHLEADPPFARHAYDISNEHLKEILTIEKELEVKATYHVVGCLMGELRTMIEQDGHCVAFHSYDHKIDQEQLPRCRRVDYRLKGYRPPQSKLTAELSESNLLFHNFEWLASSTRSLGITSPVLKNRLVKIPIRFDDFPLYNEGVTYEEWVQRAMEVINNNDFVAFCLHDCYASFWLPYYREFLGNIRRLGKLKTLNQVSSDIILANAV